MVFVLRFVTTFMILRGEHFFLMTEFVPRLSLFLYFTVN